MGRQLTPAEKMYDFDMTVGRAIREEAVIEEVWNLGLAENYMIFGVDDLSHENLIPTWAQGYHEEAKSERDGYTAEDLLLMAHEIEEQYGMYDPRSRKHRDWDAEIWFADFEDWFDAVWADL